MFCECFVLAAFEQMGVSPGLWKNLKSCGFVLISALALPSQSLGGSSGTGKVSTLASLQKNGLIYWIVPSVLCWQWPSKEVLWHTHPGLSEFIELIIFNNILGIISGWCVFAFVLMSSHCCSSVFNTPFYTFPASATLNDHGILGKATGNYIMVPTSLCIDFSTDLLVSEPKNCW